MNIQRNLCIILRNLRRNLKLSQDEFGKIFGLSQTHYANIENGKRNVTLEIVEKLIFQFEISPNEIFQKVEDEMFITDNSENEKPKKETLEDRLDRIEATLQKLSEE